MHKIVLKSNFRHGKYYLVTAITSPKLFEISRKSQPFTRQQIINEQRTIVQ